MSARGLRMRTSRWIVLAVALGAAGCHDAPGTSPAPVDQDRDGFDATIDCDDLDPAVHLAVDAWEDADGDGVGAGVPHGFCADGIIPAGYAAASTDCAPDDPTAWRAVPRPLVDADGDGYTVAGTPTVCVGDTLPQPYLGTSLGPDCDDADPAAYRWTSLYPDQDGDGVGACPRSAAWACVGAEMPPGFAAVGCDVDDANPAIAAHPADAEALGIVLD